MVSFRNVKTERKNRNFDFVFSEQTLRHKWIFFADTFRKTIVAFLHFTSTDFRICWKKTTVFITSLWEKYQLFPFIRRINFNRF